MTGKKIRRTAAVLAAAMVISQPAVWPGVCGTWNRAFADTAEAAAGAVKKDSVSASTMRLSKAEGAVEVSQAGKKMSILEEMKLHSGYTVATGEKSYAGISLDDEKAVKLDAISEAEVRKKGKKLELLLSSGSLLCDVKEPLKEEETLNIRTSTMITGIRGTVLYVKVIDEFTTMIYMLEGSASVWGVNPVTGAAENMEIGTGRCVRVTSEDALLPAIVTASFDVTDIPGYVLTAVAEDPALSARLAAAGWDTRWMAEHAGARLAEDEALAAAALAQLKAKEKTNQSTYQDHVYRDSGSNSDSGSDTGSNSGSGSDPGNEPSRQQVVLKQAPAAGQLNELLKDSDVILDIPNSSTGEYAEVRSSQDITVPEGGRLETGQWTVLHMEAGTTLTIDGTLKTAGDLLSDGVIRNRSHNTLEVGRDLVLSGRLENTGRIYVKEALSLENGSLTSQGGQIDIDGGLYLSYYAEGGGQAADQTEDGRTYDLGEDMTVQGGIYLYQVTCSVSGGTYRGGVSALGSQLQMTGGTIYPGDGGYGIEADGVSELRLLGGKVYGTGSGATVSLNGSELYLAADVLRTDDSGTPFVTGTGSLTLNIDGNTHTYDPENLPEGILEGTRTPDGWGIAAFAGEDHKNPGTATPSTATLPAEESREATPSSASKNQIQEENHE